ncbi:MAG: GNAT family N-acetyltransferase [Ruminococcaceae bacterium]|nr:GNAT family N-acetyltransferase [Oscillospiraceae bacterium]
MIRRITEADRELYYKYADIFYNSGVVNAPVPKENYKITFDEFMRSDDYVWCYIFECGGEPCGFAMLSRTFSQEAGGISVTVEEIYIDPEYRNRGMGTQFFQYMKENIPAARYRIEVEEDNEKAKRLYEKMGFEVLPYIQMVIDKHNAERRAKGE